MDLRDTKDRVVIIAGLGTVVIAAATLSRFLRRKKKSDLESKEPTDSSMEVKQESIMSTGEIVRVGATCGVSMLASHWLGAQGFSPLWALGVVGFYMSSKFRRRERRIRAQAVHVLRNPNVLRLILDELPSWVMESGTDRAEFLNYAVEKLWPSIDGATADTLRNSLHPIFDSVKPGFISKLRFEQLTLGTIPPIITGVRVQKSSAEEIVLDLDLKFAGNPNVVLGIGLANAVNMSVAVTDLSVFATLRLVLTPFLPAWPCFGTISIAFTRKPNIDFALQAVKLNIMDFPMVTNWLTNFLKNILSQYIVWPRKIVVQIMSNDSIDIDGIRKVEPKGVLHVHLIEAKNLINVDSIGLSDPFCELRIVDEVHVSKVVENNLNPKFDEQFEFLVDDTTTQRLEVQMFDKDIMSTDFLGNCEVDLSQLSPGRPSDFWLPLQGVKSGSVHFCLTWELFNSEGTGMQFEVEGSPTLNAGSGTSTTSMTTTDNAPNSSVSQSSRISQGVLFVTVHSGKDMIVCDTFSRSSDPYVILRVGNKESRTKTIKKSLSPIWEERFQFNVRDLNQESVYVCVMDQDIGKDEFMGSTTIRVADVVNALGSRLDQSWRLSDVDSGEVRLILEWRALGSSSSSSASLV